ncbi:MAG: DUF1844 domain-containing protein [Acidobacteriota bacterium]
MAESEDKPLRVVDRRMFTSDGELRPGFEPEDSPASAPPPPPPPPAAAPPSPTPAAGPGRAETPSSPASVVGGAPPPAADQEVLGEEVLEDGPAEGPRGEFSAIVRSLATTAYSAMGLLPDPTGARHREPAVARQMIDWLAVLESKTRNNLSFEETDFLSRVLYELRLAFVEVTRPPGR